ncbi:uncharacterized protein CANTADRAFT_90438 [Suhomyces tanzawaensis NRRL Y-17324]|uniref:Uncharacterized protein n=1 Tax=Suhomyces tanzawaensis NRRL Y-17324 TaxID=984487 RepID=A0A1E4SIU9_9ASCO|nr:uncharacterized protein CANTADRAFT_90438 [Suhomyces tanzawaensis NRRL Y-17324]ODV79352.1 hypothetical protein CANTADRAFT_90438 [Suhomyces tanzawaensis NRRL Y-17324]
MEIPEEINTMVIQQVWLYYFLVVEHFLILPLQSKFMQNTYMNGALWKKFDEQYQQVYILKCNYGQQV